MHPINEEFPCRPCLAEVTAHIATASQVGLTGPIAVGIRWIKHQIVSTRIGVPFTIGALPKLGAIIVVNIGTILHFNTTEHCFFRVQLC